MFKTGAVNHSNPESESIAAPRARGHSFPNKRAERSVHGEDSPPRPSSPSRATLLHSDNDVSAVRPESGLGGRVRALERYGWRVAATGLRSALAGVTAPFCLLFSIPGGSSIGRLRHAGVMFLVLTAALVLHIGTTWYAFADTAIFTVSANPEAIREGEVSTLTVAISNGVTFTDEQTFSLAMSGTASSADYEVKPTTLTLAAGESSVTVELEAIDDEEEEEAETVTVASSHGGVSIGSAMVTITSVSHDATLSDLNLSGIDIGTFSGEWTSYSAYVDDALKTTTVTVTANHARASVSISPAAEVRLEEGENVIAITVTAEDGVTTQTYTVTVIRVVRPLTGRLESVSQAHSGSGAIHLQLFFSEPVSIDYQTLRDTLTVTNGDILSIWWRGGSNYLWEILILWEIVIAPSSDADIVVVLPATTDCNAAGAVCTAENKPLSNYLTAIIPGPPHPVVSIAAAEYSVQEGEAAAFVLTRSEATEESLTVSVSTTESGSMIAGAAVHSVTFSERDTTTTLGVPTDPDAVEEADSIVTATVMEAIDYEVVQPSSAAVTVEDNDSATFTVSATPETIAEGESATVTVAISNGVTFAEDQTVALVLSGSASSGDYTGVSSAVTLLAGMSSVTADLAASEDQEEEAAETVTVAASHGGVSIGSATVIITSVSHDATVPDAPGGLTVATPEGREGELNVSWTAPESDGGSMVTGYKVQWKSGTEDYDGSAASTRQAAVSNPAILSHRIVGLSVGTAYTVRVMAVNATGDGAAAEAVAAAEDRVVPALAGASVNGTALMLTFSEALDAVSKPSADAFAVTVAGTARTIAEVALSESSVTLTLASAVASGETVTVGYAGPTGANAAPLKDAAGNPVAGFTGEAVTNETPVPANTAPTGLPVITGIAWVGETLTASVQGIADADGLDRVTFTYQWLVNDGTDDTEITGATGTTHEVAPAQVGKTLKVRVTFTDDGGTEETLTSVATAAVTIPFTASFSNVPESHDGSTAFIFELRFSEEFRISYKTVRDAVLEVSGGTVTRARRLARPSNTHWKITVRPATEGTVTIVLPAGRACGGTGAICTENGRRLSRPVERAISGPASAGLPTIRGKARVGKILEASVERIEEADGLPAAAFAYQWLVNDGTDDTEISGATAATYTIPPTDLSKTLKVSVAFTGDGGTQKTLTSLATAPVAEPVPVPTVSIAPGKSPVREGAQAAFTLTRTGDVTNALTVTVLVTETGAVLDGAEPSEPTFEAGAARVAIVVATADDEVVEDASAVTATVVAGYGYTVSAAGASAEVTVEDDDAAPEVMTASALAVAENATAAATLEATDADTDVGSLAWSIAGGVDAGAFTLTEAGALALQAAKDFEAPDDADGDGSYEVTVRVTDGANPVDAALTVSLTDVDEIAPVLAGATVNGATLTLTFSEALDATSKPPADAFAVTVAGTARGVDGVALSGSSVTLTLASGVAAGETVTVGYAAPTGVNAAPLKDAAGNALAGFTGEAVTNETPAPPNTAPTGLPEISGTPRVDETLTASTDGIADADGLDNVTFTYQWIANDSTDDTEIEDATGATHEVAVTEVGKTLKVRVTFTDGGGTEETLTSAATATVAALPVEVSIAAEGTSVTEGRDAVFRLRRSGDAAAALTVGVRVSASGTFLDGAAPTEASFAAGASTATLPVATENDGTAEADGHVSASITADTGYVAADGADSAGVDVLDNDRTAAQVMMLWSATMTVVDYGTGAIGAGSAELLTNEGGSAGSQREVALVLRARAEASPDVHDRRSRGGQAHLACG